MYGKQNFCQVGELSRYLLTPGKKVQRSVSDSSPHANNSVLDNCSADFHILLCCDRAVLSLELRILTGTLSVCQTAAEWIWTMLNFVTNVEKTGTLESNLSHSHLVPQKFHMGRYRWLSV
jgi:hypothetical protein